MSKAIALFCKADFGFLRLTRYIFMPVQDHLSGERRMTTDLDGDVPPLGIEDMKRVVVYIGLLTFQVAVNAHIPYWRLGAAYQNEE
jgi:hypothetical protein